MVQSKTTARKSTLPIEDLDDVPTKRPAYGYNIFVADFIRGLRLGLGEGSHRFIGHVRRSKEFDLQCFGGYKICEMHSRENVITNNSVFQELETVMRLVCETHRLPLAMAWVPCSACIDDDDLAEFSSVSECSHLRKGWAARRALSSPYMLYFPSITKLSIDEYPLVPYARICEFSGWFIICLRSSNTGDDIYVLEFFWSTSSEDYENIQTRLNKLLGTMEDKLENFRFASGPKLGYLSYVEVIDVQNNKKTHEVLEIQATRTFSNSDLSTEQSSTSVSYVRPW